MADKLKKCPFCGKQCQNPKDPFALIVEQIPDKTGWFVRCRHCSAEGPVEEIESIAIQSWNTRAPIENEGSNA